MRRKVNLAKRALADEAAYSVVADVSEILGVEFAELRISSCDYFSRRSIATYSSSSWYELASCVARGQPI